MRKFRVNRTFQFGNTASFAGETFINPVGYPHFMTENIVEEKFQSLHETLERIKALRAWQALKCQEARPDQLPVFQFSDPTPVELRNEESAFWYQAQQLRDLLEDRRKILMSVSQRITWKNQLLQLERQVRQSQATDRFINN